MKNNENIIKRTLRSALKAERNIDYENAIRLYQKAASLGEPFALLKLARIYIYGLGIPINYEKAFKLTEEAAKYNYSWGKASLALLYIHGIGVEKDYNIALLLLLEAQSYGDKDYQPYITKILSEINPNVSTLMPVF